MRTVFYDDYSRLINALDHSEDEDCFILFGINGWLDVPIIIEVRAMLAEQFRHLIQ